MRIDHLKILLATVALSGCGASYREANGFFTDANICRPLELPDYNPIDVLSGNFALPAPQSATVRTAQLAAAETTKKSVWGAEIFVSSGLNLTANLRIKPLIKRQFMDPLDVTTFGPDGSIAADVSFGSVQTISAKIEPGWVRAQFPGVLSLEAGDAVWLTVEPDFSGDQQAMWWYTAGEGAYFSAADSPLYIEVPGVQAVHRLIYCD